MLRTGLALKNTVQASAALRQQSRTYAKATIVGRLGNVPDKRESGNGKTYYRYSLAVENPPRRDEKGELVRDENGYPVRESKWFSVFAFDEKKADALENMRVGGKYLVEVSLDTRSTDLGDGRQGSEIVLRELSHRIVSAPAQKEAA